MPRFLQTTFPFPARADTRLRRCARVLVIGFVPAVLGGLLGGWAVVGSVLVATLALVFVRTRILRAHGFAADPIPHPGPGGCPPGMRTAGSVPTGTLAERLTALHDDYRDRVNLVIEEDREDLAHELSDAYAGEALRMITAGGSPPARA